MRSVVIHPPHELRVEDVPDATMGPGQVRVAVKAGGICGSDMHYYRHGGFGSVRVKAPMVLGHEASGTVLAAAPDVTGLAIGDRVAINPSRPCRACRYCLEGLPNHCENMRFYGSAMPWPHVDGAFRDELVCDAGQCEAVTGDTSYEELALCEPLAVVLHGARQAGSLLQKRVLVTGSGPIGALAVAVARHFGAEEITATDVLPEPLLVARRLGADRTVDVAASPDGLASAAAGKGTFDALFECSGNEAAIRAALPAMRPGATIVQLGIAGGDVAFPLNLVVAKELVLKGSFRFAGEFALAAKLIGSRRLDLRPLLSRTYPVKDARAAFEAAGDRRTAMKVHLAFG